MSESEVAVMELGELRRRAIGGHGAGAIAEVHPHLKPIDVYRQMTAPLVDEPTDEMLWGRAIEPILLWWGETKILQGGITPGGPKLSSKWPWLRSHPDGEFGGHTTMTPGLVSAKHVGAYRARFWGSEKTDHVPDYANVQEQLYMGLLGHHVSYVVAAIGGKPPKLWAVPFNERVFDALLQSTQAFMRRHVDLLHPPPPDGSEAYKRWIKDSIKFREPELLAVADGDDMMAIVREYKDARLEAERRGVVLELADQRLRMAIGGMEGMALPSKERILFKETSRKDKEGNAIRQLRVPKSFTLKGEED